MEYNIESDVRILIHGKENYCSKSKKGNLKTKKLLKITILDEQEPWSLKQGSGSQISGSLKLRKYEFTKTWKVAVTTSISENK